MSNEAPQPNQSENLPTSPEECYKTAELLWVLNKSPGDRKRAFQLWLYAANNLNHDRSALRAGAVLDEILKNSGDPLIPTNNVRAKALYERAAEAGNVKAMISLGNLLTRGDGIEHDPLRARQLFERGADAGYTEAIYNLGVLYRDGAEGITRDTLRAKQLFERAASEGQVNAIYNLGVLYRDDAEGIKRNKRRAKKLFRRAAKAGHQKAMRNLEALELGTGCEISVQCCCFEWIWNSGNRS